MDTTQINHLSLCSGYGGIDLGLRRVLPTCRTIAYVEIEAFACANLVEKMESKQLDAAPIWTNLKTFDARPFRGKVDILSGGFPCQPFSHAGQRKGTDDPRHLFPDIERIILECEPRIVFLENVEGIISSKYGGTEQSVLHYVLGRLEALGYRATAGIFSAEEVGYPHRRKRVFICGVSNTDSGRCGGRNREGCADGERLIFQREQEGCQVGGKTEGRSELGDTDNYWYSEDRGRYEKKKRVPGEHREEVCRRVSGGTNEQSGDECAEVVNPADEGLERHSRGVSGEEEPTGEGERNERNSPLRSIFPSRPTEPQRPWEAPRTIGETEEVITALGGSTYGSANGDMVRSCRVDSLRLLGNGVVPMTAERAFVVLMEKLR